MTQHLGEQHEVTFGFQNRNNASSSKKEEATGRRTNEGLGQSLSIRFLFLQLLSSVARLNV